MNSIGDTILEFLTNPTGWNINDILAQVIVTSAMIVLWIIAGIILLRVLKIVIYKSMRVEKNGARALTVSKLLNSIVKYVVWFIIILLILGELNVNITPFIASAGVVGLAIGFGAQEIVRDFISGFFIIFEGSFDVGDVVEVDGFKGTVLSLGLRTTIIENWLGERKIINNGKIGSIINCSKNDSIAIIDFGVGYDTDLNELNKVMASFVEELESRHEVIVETPQFLGVTELADSSINMRMIAKTKAMQHFQVERDIRKELVEVLVKNNIDIPFPQVVVHNA
ncbi:putative MscS family protein YkuT [Candidatus Izimaplasma bacterium HR1]|jgi:small conductance mechanosensitive channel|uniref:mechanosensitive ion channel family protein n=1 Tax=Candidatus Izimoplasma sp. HR1 TaxID=1541959 RepID=UPI0004F86708|nr:putative MscS family protein YkuT [Candidatus Izimaplasma bacterium HR1]